jgi:hypothetical protein
MSARQPVIPGELTTTKKQSTAILTTIPTVFYDSFSSKLNYPFPED